MPEEKAEKKGQRKQRIGTVVSDAMSKTIVVAVERRAPHPLYKKVVKSRERYVAHDEKEEAGTGDTVKIEETRPLSRTKRWRLLEIIEKAEK